MRIKELTKSCEEFERDIRRKHQHRGDTLIQISECEITTSGELDDCIKLSIQYEYDTGVSKHVILDQRIFVAQ